MVIGFVKSVLELPGATMELVDNSVRTVKKIKSVVEKIEKLITEEQIPIGLLIEDSDKLVQSLTDTSTEARISLVQLRQELISTIHDVQKCVSEVKTETASVIRTVNYIGCAILVGIVTQLPLGADFTPLVTVVVFGSIAAYPMWKAINTPGLTSNRLVADFWRLTGNSKPSADYFYSEALRSSEQEKKESCLKKSAQLYLECAEYQKAEQCLLDLQKLSAEHCRVGLSRLSWQEKQLMQTALEMAQESDTSKAGKIFFQEALRCFNAESRLSALTVLGLDHLVPDFWVTTKSSIKHTFLIGLIRLNQSRFTAAEMFFSQVISQTKRGDSLKYLAEKAKNCVYLRTGQLSNSYFGFGNSLMHDLETCRREILLQGQKAEIFNFNQLNACSHKLKELRRDLEIAATENREEIGVIDYYLGAIYFLVDRYDRKKSTTYFDDAVRHLSNAKDALDETQLVEGHDVYRLLALIYYFKRDFVSAKWCLDKLENRAIEEDGLDQPLMSTLYFNECNVDLDDFDLLIRLIKLSKPQNIVICELDSPSIRDLPKNELSFPGFLSKRGQEIDDEKNQQFREQFALFVEALFNLDLNYLQMSHSNVIALHVDILAEKLPAVQCKKLSLAHNHLGSEGFHVIAQQLCTSSLEGLDLSHNDIDDFDTSSFYPIIAEQNTRIDCLRDVIRPLPLRSLDLSHNNFLTEDFYQVFELLALSNISRINLVHSGSRLTVPASLEDLMSGLPLEQMNICDEQFLSISERNRFMKLAYQTKVKIRGDPALSPYGQKTNRWVYADA